MSREVALRFARSERYPDAVKLCNWNGYEAYRAIGWNEYQGSSFSEMRFPHVFFCKGNFSRWAKPLEQKDVLKKYYLANSDFDPNEFDE